MSVSKYWIWGGKFRVHFLIKTVYDNIKRKLGESSLTVLQLAEMSKGVSWAKIEQNKYFKSFTVIPFP
jgi:hypothetical protein